jgi:hypothetical protein
MITPANGPQGHDHREGDHGEADARLAAALASGDSQRVLALLPAVRLLVPVVATPAAGEAQMEAQLAVPALVNEAGRRALPAFTSVAELAAWDADARPVPMPGHRIFAAALAEGYDGVVLDVAAAKPVTIDREALAALAVPGE